MRIGLVVDSGCDLPKSFIDEHNIMILPISVRVGDDLFVDVRDPERVLEFYQRHAIDKHRQSASHAG